MIDRDAKLRVLRGLITFSAFGPLETARFAWERLSAHKSADASTARRLSFHPRRLGKKRVFVRKGTTDLRSLEDVAFHGYYLPEVRLRSPAVIVDLGANVGLTAIDLAVLHPSAR